MAKGSVAAPMDLYLDAIAGADKMVLCDDEPTTFAEADTTFALAEVAMDSGDFNIGAGDSGGNVSRKPTVAAQNGVPIDASGDATHVALVDTVSSTLLFVTTCTLQALVAGGTVNIPAWEIEVGAPA